MAWMKTAVNRIWTVCLFVCLHWYSNFFHSQKTIPMSLLCMVSYFYTTHAILSSPPACGKYELYPTPLYFTQNQAFMLQKSNQQESLITNQLKRTCPTSLKWFAYIYKSLSFENLLLWKRLREITQADMTCRGNFIGQNKYMYSNEFHSYVPPPHTHTHTHKHHPLLWHNRPFK